MSGASLNGFRQDALLKTGGEVLEIGFGTGLNLPHYPDSVQKIDAVDVIPAMFNTMISNSILWVIVCSYFF